MTQSDIAALARQSLICYSIAQWSGYRPADHHRLISDALERVCNGTCKRLMIQMPPRHGKSMLASEFFPSYYLGHHPDHQIIHATYAQTLADDFGRKVRNLMREPLFSTIFPGITLAEDSQASARFHTNKKGVYHGVGIEGGATGKGADLLLIDDPVKDREAAESETIREKIKNWYKSVAYTRLMPNAAIVIIQTRWHEDDLSGWVEEEHRHEDWEILRLPAISKDNTALWPESYPLERLLVIERTIGPRDFQSLYQQNPRPVDGAVFKRQWLQYYGNLDARGMNRVILVDPASGKRKNNDYTTMWVIGLGQDGNRYILDLVRDRLNLTERAATLFRLHRKWKPGEVRYEQYGLQADIEHIKSRMDDMNYRFAIVEVAGRVSKEDRVKRLVPLFQNGRIWMPHQLMYTDTRGEVVDLIHTFVETEFLSFPVGRHDDMIDALARMEEPDLELPWPMEASPEDLIPVIPYGVLDPEMGI